MCTNDATYNVVISDVLAGRLAPPKRAGGLLDSDRPVKLPRPHWCEQMTDFLMSVPVPKDSMVADASGSSSGASCPGAASQQDLPASQSELRHAGHYPAGQTVHEATWVELLQTHWDLVEGSEVLRRPEQLLSMTRCFGPHIRVFGGFCLRLCLLNPVDPNQQIDMLPRYPPSPNCVTDDLMNASKMYRFRKVGSRVGYFHTGDGVRYLVISAMVPHERGNNIITDAVG